MQSQSARALFVLTLLIQLVLTIARSCVRFSGVHIASYICIGLGVYALKGRNPFRLTLYLCICLIHMLGLFIGGVDMIIHAENLSAILTSAEAIERGRSPLALAGAKPLTDTGAAVRVSPQALRIDGILALSTLVLGVLPSLYLAVFLHKHYLDRFEADFNRLTNPAESETQEEAIDSEADRLAADAFPLYSGNATVSVHANRND